MFFTPLIFRVFFSDSSVGLACCWVVGYNGQTEGLLEVSCSSNSGFSEAICCTWCNPSKLSNEIVRTQEVSYALCSGKGFDSVSGPRELVS